MMSSPELVARAWVLLLSLTVALLAVAALRPVCRRWLGAERAFQLWLLPPLAMLVSQLPHAAGVAGQPLPPLVLTVTTVAGAVGASHRHDADFVWQDAAGALWLFGVVTGVVVAAM